MPSYLADVTGPGFTRGVRIEHCEHGVLIEQFVDEAIWELMYFGHARPPHHALKRG
jgi:hypothetical protein